MKNDLRLFIGGSEIELGSSPQILYTYTVDDLQNPTAVKNSFSKTITIDGTPNNNRVFGQYWNVERLVGGGGGSGVDYNASKKVEFVIYVNSEIYESGYVKMEKINSINGRYTYDISLFGGLGDYFYSLSFNDNTGDKKRLSDLTYTEGGDANEFDFVATATTITEAWDALYNGTAGKWQHINFVPAYNGYPEDFDTDKVVINLSGTTLPSSDPDGYLRPYTGCVIADLPEEMTEWEIRDLRSYCQRPAIRMKSIINACCDETQNGGYTVDLDPDFFNDDNPYWTKTWLTLPLMKNLEYANEEQTLEGSKLIGLTTTGNVESMMYQDLKFDVGDYASSTPSTITMEGQMFVNNIFDQLNIEINPYIGMLADIEAPYTSFAWFWNRNGDSYHTGWWCLGSLFVQLIAMNGEVVVGASNAYNLTSPIRHNGKLYYGHNGRYSSNNKFRPYNDMPIYDVLGQFEEDGFHRENSNTPALLDFTIRNINGPVSQLKMVYFYGATDDKIKHFNKYTFFGKTQQSDWIDIGGPDPEWYSVGDPFPLTIGVKSTNLKAVLGASLGRTGTKVGKSLLLNTEASPAEYLLSYCKMFGLYFRKEVDKKVIHIETRKTFYDRDTVVNLNDYIDRGKDIKVNPLVFTTKWYDMVQEQDDSQFYEKYISAYGIEYGSKLLNTGYEFNVEKKKLYDKSVIRSGIEGLERSKFFSAFNDDARQRSWMGMGLHYTIPILGEESFEVNVPIRNNNDLMGINEGEGMKYYDVYPKMQFHGVENKPTDGNNVLVFFSGFKSVTSGRSNPLRYYVSDDNMYQTLYNDGTPCWLYTASDYINNERFVYTVNRLPVFERYYTDTNSGKVNKSLDFGTPQELFIPNYSITEDVNIYTNYWRTYISDLFDPNTRVLTCYVVANGKVSGDWLRRFYWFDNAIWRINKITDWNLAEFGPTQMEFVKVQDIGDYTVPTQRPKTKINLTSTKYRVVASGETVSLSVTISNGGNWRITSSGGAVLSRVNGVGDTTLTATIPTNNTTELQGYYFTISSDDDAQARITIIQGYEGETDFSVVPERIIVPASGGSASITFDWKNQGSDYVDTVDYNDGEGYLQFTADTTTYRNENRAVLTFSANTTDEVLSNYCQFQSHDGINHSVIIDQLPSIISYENTGGSKTITLSESGASVSGLPYWVTASVSGNAITFTSIPNDYGERSGEGYVSVGGTSAQISFTQGSGGTPSNFSVSPENLYFDASGGTKFIDITTNLSWYENEWSGAWWTSSQSAGTGSATVAITVGANESASTRSNYMRLYYYSGNTLQFKNVFITQAGTDTPTGDTISIAIQPSAVTVASTGETRTFDVTVTGDMTNLVATSRLNFGSGYEQIEPVLFTWNGNNAQLVYTIPANEGIAERQGLVIVSLRRANQVVASGSAIVTQDEQEPYVRVTDTVINHPSTGSSSSVTVTSNRMWTATTTSDWIHFSPASGSSTGEVMTITTDTYTGTTGRSGIIVIGYNGTTLKTIAVNQQGFAATLSVFPSSILFDSNGGTATFTITSNTNWTIE